MINIKVLSIFNSLESKYSEICEEIQVFMNGIIEWGNELPEVLENELSRQAEFSLFAVPKTPCEMRTQRKARLNSKSSEISKQSVLNSTVNQNDIFNMNDSISVRTRSARRAASKMSQLNNTKNKLELPLNYSEMATILVEEKAKNDVDEATFVVPKTTTRTKPIVRKKEQKSTVPELKSLEKPVDANINTELNNSASQRNESKLRENFSRSMENISRTVSENSPELQANRKLSRTLSGSPSVRPSSKKGSLIVNDTLVVERPSRRKVSKSLSGCQSGGEISESPTLRSSGVVIPRSPSQSPIVRSSNARKSPIRRSSRNNISSSILQNCNPTTPEFNSLANRTVTIKKESTPIATVVDEVCNSMQDEDTTPPVAAKTFTKLSKKSPTFVADNEKTASVTAKTFINLSKSPSPLADKEKTPTNNKAVDETQEYNASTVTLELDHMNTDTASEIVTEEAADDVPVPKKKRKLKKKEEAKENIEDNGTVRITRTKSRALKKMLEENEGKQADLSAIAKKLLNKAKMTSMRKSKLAAVIECNASTPVNRPGQPNLPFGILTSSKYHLLLSSSKKFKTPLATLPNSAVKLTKSTQDKDQVKRKIAKRDSSAENMVRSVTKPPKDDQYEKEIKLKSKKEKEEEAALKRQIVIKSKQEELKKKNELKRQMAMKQREKLEQEKYQNMVQLEKEKEERHKLILQERQMKLKEEAFKKKMITMQKIAETTERRRLEEEARIARLKEIEAEEQRIALEKQKEQERQEKRAQERLAQKKAREEYEMQLKQELEAERIKAEKMSANKKCMSSASKMQSASKRQKFAILGEKKDWDYKPRNENDYGLENENSESEDDNSYSDSKSPMPWASKILNMKSPTVKVLTLEMLCEFLPCYQKSPDVHRMFKMTPSKRIKRSSSAIWNTPSS